MFWFVVGQVFSFVLDVVVLQGQSDREKDLEILLLRQQLRIVERKQVQRRGLSRWEKLNLAVLLAWFKAVSCGSGERLREVMRLFQLETVLKWHRERVRRKWTYAHTPKPRGNAPLSVALETLIIQLARDNARFGYKKLVGELGKLGYQVGRSTVRDVLKRHGIQPASERVRRSGHWRTFSNRHKDSVLACDFFTVETVWLQTLYVLFFIELNTRRVYLAGCTCQPTAVWVTQQARQFVWNLQTAPSLPRSLIHDRDSKFSASFDHVFMSEEIAIIRTPRRHPMPMPTLNAGYAPFVRNVWITFSC